MKNMFRVEYIKRISQRILELFKKPLPPEDDEVKVSLEPLSERKCPNRFRLVTIPSPHLILPTFEWGTDQGDTDLFESAVKLLDEGQIIPSFNLVADIPKEILGNYNGPYKLHLDGGIYIRAIRRGMLLSPAYLLSGPDYLGPGVVVSLDIKTLEILLNLLDKTYEMTDILLDKQRVASSIVIINRILKHEQRIAIIP